MGAFSIWHLLIIAVVAGVLFFGWKQLPDMARSAGRSLRVFKTEIKGMSEDDKSRDGAQDDADAEPRQLESRPPAQADLQPRQPVAQPVQQPVQSPVQPQPEHQPVPQPAAQSGTARPRPTPSPNGRSGR